MAILSTASMKAIAAAVEGITGPKKHFVVLIWEEGGREVATVCPDRSDEIAPIAILQTAQHIITQQEQA